MVYSSATDPGGRGPERAVVDVAGRELVEAGQGDILSQPLQAAAPHARERDAGKAAIKGEEGGKIETLTQPGY